MRKNSPVGVVAARSRKRRALLAGALACLIATPAAAAVQQLAPNLYAYISENDASANSTFLVTPEGILLVDTGLNAVEAGKLLHAIRSISAAPVRYIINTHYHPDHQGGNAVFGRDAVVVSAEATRQRTLALLAETKAGAADAAGSRFCPADITFSQQLEIHLANESVIAYFQGRAHTVGDVMVYFPRQRTVAMGDIFLNRSSPAMEEDGSVENWIRILDFALALPAEHFVPGHFEVGTRADVQRFRNYLADLHAHVRALYRRGASLAEVRRSAALPQYADFRQYPRYHATFADNAETIYRQLGGK